MRSKPKANRWLAIAFDGRLLVTDQMTKADLELNRIFAGPTAPTLVFQLTKEQAAAYEKVFGR